MPEHNDERRHRHAEVLGRATRWYFRRPKLRRSLDFAIGHLALQYRSATDFYISSNNEG